MQKKTNRFYYLLFSIISFSFSIMTYVSTILAHPQDLWQMIDLQVYIEGGKAIALSHQLYQTSFTIAHLPFTYPPFAAIMFALLSSLSFQHLQIAMIGINITALIISIWLSWRILGYKKNSILLLSSVLLLSAICLWLEPIQQTLSFGQVNILLMMLILIDMNLKGQNRLKGLCIGIATGCKLTPGIFILYLFLTKRIRAALIAIITLLFTVAIGYIIIPKESLNYWNGSLFDATRVGGVAYVANQSIYGTLIRLMHGGSPAKTLWLLFATLTTLTGITLAISTRKQEELFGIITCAITGLLVSPVSWSHHWVWVVALIVLLAHLAIIKRIFLALITLIGVIELFFAWFVNHLPKGIIWTVPSTHNQEYSWQGYQHIRGELYVLLGIAYLLTILLLILKKKLYKSFSNHKRISVIKTVFLAISARL